MINHSSTLIPAWMAGSSDPKIFHGTTVPEENNATDATTYWAIRLARQKAITNKKTRQATVRAEQAERTRIGYELHDNVNPILASAHLMLSSLDPEDADFGLIKEKAIEIIGLAIEEIRCLTHHLVSPNLRNQGLIESINKLVETLRYARQFTVDFTWTDLRTIEIQDDDLKLAVYRIIQEQIRNICKYSRAKTVRINLQGIEQQLRLEIADDGIGFDPKTVRQGIGLSHICERALLYKGKAIVNAAPGRGCTLIVTIPLELRTII